MNIHEYQAKDGKTHPRAAIIGEYVRAMVGYCGISQQKTGHPPDVVGVHLTGSLREGVTATDLALTVTQLMRKTKVVGKFVEFFGPGAAALPLVDRATIANMAPEYGATIGIFPIDEETLKYLRFTARDEAVLAVDVTFDKNGFGRGRPAWSESTCGQPTFRRVSRCLASSCLECGWP